MNEVDELYDEINWLADLRCDIGEKIVEVQAEICNKSKQLEAMTDHLAELNEKFYGLYERVHAIKKNEAAS